MDLFSLCGAAAFVGQKRSKWAKWVWLAIILVPVALFLLMAQG
jgi:hypothetical protein